VIATLPKKALDCMETPSPGNSSAGRLDGFFLRLLNWALPVVVVLLALFGRPASASKAQARGKES